MKRYCIKGQSDKSEYLDVLTESEDGFTVRLTRVCDGDKKTRDEFITRSLFDICLKTGYLSELDGELNVSAA